ncbi:MAG: efflux RND transporter periplasmic adaptor subunit [bacterium JZ-2024 1]
MRRFLLIITAVPATLFLIAILAGILANRGLVAVWKQPNTLPLPMIAGTDMSHMPGMSHRSNGSGEGKHHEGHGPTHDVPRTVTLQDTEGMTDMAGVPTAIMSPEIQQLFGIRKSRPIIKDLTRDLTTFGIVEYDESSIKFVTTRYSGWITDILADFTGANIRKGDHIASVYSPEIYTATEELLLAAQARNRLKDSPFPEVARGAVSLYEKAWRRLELLGLTQDQIEAVVTSGKPVEHLPVLAPESGTVLKKMISEGSRVSAGDPLFQIADLSRLWVIASFYDPDAPHIKVGQTAMISFDSQPGRTFPAQVSFIYPNLDPFNRTLRVRFDLHVPEGSIRPGMFANVTLRLNLGRFLVVPEDAVMDTGMRQIVFVEMSEGHFMAHRVVTGPSANGWTAILSGLTSSDRVVVDAGFFVDAESKIRSTMSEMDHMGH